MGLLARLGQKFGGRVPEVYLEGPGLFGTAIVGESHYQAVLEYICGGRTDDGADEVVIARLVLEDENPYDTQAVRVEIEGHTVGYLSRSDARLYRERLTVAGQPRIIGQCTARIRGGWDRGPEDRGLFGVYLDILA